MVGIYAPSYTTKELLNKIIIESNEPISNQEIYITDSNGIRHNYTFDREDENTLVGLVKFINYPLGIVTISARVKDEVDNISNLVSKSIVIKESLTLLKLEIKDTARHNEILDISRKSDIGSLSRMIEVNEESREV